MKRTLVTAKINLATNKLSAFITLGVVVAVIISGAISTCFSNGESTQISLGSYFYLYILMIPFFIVCSNYKKLIHLNADKRTYYAGSILTYAIAALLVSGCNTVFYTFEDALRPLYATLPMSNLMELTGWMSNGVLIALIQQTAFLFLLAVTLHTLISLQTSWVGWVVDAVIIAVISVFTPIAPLRNVLVGFFQLVMFNRNFLLHIAVCLGLSALIGMLGMISLKKRTA